MSDATTSVATSNDQSDTSSEWKHTYGYIGGALACLAITGGLNFANRSAPIKEYGRVGEEFYAEFVDPTLAASLEVNAFDADAVAPKEFRVQRLPNGRWVIPSHHNYPADAEEQLAKTASSVIGIKRGAMVTRWEADHAQYGVVNPKQESLTVNEVDGVGQRLTLRGDNDSVLADYVVGKQVEGESGQYYLRHPNEDEVYIASLDIDLSTKFTDWIETDLFDISNGEILRLVVNDYSFNELNGQLTESEVTTLTREKTWSDDWLFTELNAETEELNKDAIRDTLSAIADLEIAGVREKQPGLTPDLKLDQSALSSQDDVSRLQSDLLSRGFLLQPGEKKDALTLIAREGELYSGTADGLVYRMHFGRVFTGSQEELEIGFTAASDGDSATDSGDKQASQDDEQGDTEGNSDTGNDAQPDDSTKPGRYVFVRVDFDRSLLGEELVKPTEPEKPAGLEVDPEPATDAESADAETDSDSEEDSEGETEDSADDEENAAEAERQKLQQEYDAAKKKFDDDLQAYEEQQKKIADGEKKAEELNRRFAEWYYVIPGESYDKLSLSRADLVKAKEPEEEESDDPPGGSNISDGASTPEASQDTSEAPSEVVESEPVADPEPSPTSEQPTPDPTSDGSGDLEQENTDDVPQDEGSSPQ